MVRHQGRVLVTGQPAMDAVLLSVPDPEYFGLQDPDPRFLLRIRILSFFATCRLDASIVDLKLFISDLDQNFEKFRIQPCYVFYKYFL